LCPPPDTPGPANIVDPQHLNFEDAGRVFDLAFTIERPAPRFQRPADRIGEIAAGKAERTSPQPLDAASPHGDGTRPNFRDRT
jgi:hypothetical protein